MAIGVPFITSNVGGATNFFTSGCDSIITNVEDPEDTYKAIESLIINEELRKKLIINAFGTVKKYTVQKMAEQTSNYYKSKLN
jgi:glycosyltransferase involved in cell wall biosynthesis